MLSSYSDGKESRAPAEFLRGEWGADIPVPEIKQEIVTLLKAENDKNHREIKLGQYI